MNSIKFVHVPVDKYYEFIKGATESEDIVECATYINMKENKIYFVERPKHGGMFELIHDEMPNWRGKRKDIGVYDDYSGGYHKMIWKSYGFLRGAMGKSFDFPK